MAKLDVLEMASRKSLSASETFSITEERKRYGMTIASHHEEEAYRYLARNEK